MWLLAANPTSGRGSGATTTQLVSNYLNDRGINYRLVTGANAIAFQENLRTEANIATGIIAVGGDGLIHMCLQVAAQQELPMVCIPAGTGNDFVRTLGWQPDKPLEPLWAASVFMAHLMPMAWSKLGWASRLNNKVAGMRPRHLSVCGIGPPCNPM